MTVTTPWSPRRHPVRRRRHPFRAAASVIALGLIAPVACGGDDDTTGATTPTTASRPTAPSAPAPTAPATTASGPATTQTAPATTPSAPATAEAPATTEAPAPMEPVERADPAIFDYERISPVDYEVIDTRTFRDYEMQRIKFLSDRGGMAYGYLSLPVGEPVPGAGVLWAHGAPTDGTDSFVPMAVFACAGATSIVVDAPYARPGANRSGEAFLWTTQDRDEQIQLVVDMRRALDLLTDLGAERLAMSGISYGGAIGGQLIGVDDRVEFALLLLGDGGVVERFTNEEGEPTWEIAGLPDAQREEWFDAMRPIEPSLYIGDSEAEVLFMNSLEDPLIPPAEAERYHAAARPGSYEVYWMDDVHDIPFADFPYHNRWLGERVGLDGDRLDRCTHEIYPHGWDDL